jgi:hypothetical protein
MGVVVPSFMNKEVRYLQCLAFARERWHRERQPPLSEENLASSCSCVKPSPRRMTRAFASVAEASIYRKSGSAPFIIQHKRQTYRFKIRLDISQHSGGFFRNVRNFFSTSNFLYSGKLSSAPANRQGEGMCLLTEFDSQQLLPQL